jgi:hypothetical protein
VLFSKRGYAKRNKSFIAREGRYSSLSAPKGGALPALPQPENITMHWDLTDLSTMWKDTSRTTPHYGRGPGRSYRQHSRCLLVHRQPPAGQHALPPRVE